MTDARFEICLPFILKEEGGNDDDPNDHGGRTSRGITQSEDNAYDLAHGIPVHDVWKAPQSEIHDIYYDNYWLPRCPKLHPGVDLAYFNFAVNAGPGRAEQFLLKSISNSPDDTPTVEKFCDLCVSYYRSLAQFPLYGKGWLARTSRIRAAALKMVVPPSATGAQPKGPDMTNVTMPNIDFATLEKLVGQVLPFLTKLVPGLAPFETPIKTISNDLLQAAPGSGAHTALSIFVKDGLPMIGMFIPQLAPFMPIITGLAGMLLNATPPGATATVTTTVSQPPTTGTGS